MKTEGLAKSVKTDKGAKGMKPNTMQRRPGTSKPSPPKPFKIYRSQGK